MNGFPQITALTTGAPACLQMVLQFMTSMARARHKQGLGDGGHRDLEIAIRRHGNLVENAAILLIVLLLAEIGGLSRQMLMVFAVLTVTARIFHAIGLTISPDRPHPIRFFGAMATIALGLAGGAWLIWRAMA